MSDMDCEYCSKEKYCKRAYQESSCPFSLLEWIDENKRNQIISKCNEILDLIKELEKLDEDEELCCPIQTIESQIQFQIIDYLDDDIAKEYKELNELERKIKNEKSNSKNY